MLEITIFEDGLELGTFDVDSSLVKVGSVIIDDMLIMAIELAPKTGEDAIVTIEFI